MNKAQQIGHDSEVADVITGEEADSVFYGVVQTATRSLVEDNGADVRKKISVMCTDGITRTVNIDKSLNYPGEQVTAIESKSVSGTINDTATALGDYALADDVQILDTTSEGLAGTVRPSRIAGTKLNALAVRYYTLNEQGQIDRLILNDVTGDLWKYGVLDDVKNLAFNASSILGTLTGSGSSGSGIALPGTVLPAPAVVPPGTAPPVPALPAAPPPPPWWTICAVCWCPPLARSCGA